MDYLTPAQLEDHLTANERSRLDAAGTTPDRRAILAAQVSEEVAGYVGDRTLSHVPAALTYHAGEIARYRLYRDTASERITAGHDAAIKYLMAVQAGKISLPLADDPATPEDESAQAGVWIVSKPLLLGTPW